MCGITGFTTCDKKLIKTMTKQLMHRGPDDYGYYSDDDVNLGHRRLSIIDLKGGHQPIHNEDETIWIVFNGEIYNFEELKKRYLKSHRFYTNSDTEVIVHLYEEFGENCVDYLRGAFAFAIWNSNKKKLFIVRDRLGIKPLYYIWEKGVFYFSSDIKPLLEVDFLKTINKKSFENLLIYRCIPGNDTIINKVKKLLPGHSLVYEKGRLSINKYWDSKTIKTFNRGNYIERLKSILEESVRMRLLSEVPLGIFLSGGVDSSIVTSLVSKFSDTVKTFSVGFNYEQHNELYDAKIVSDYFGTDHHEKIVDIDIIKSLPEIVLFADEPIADPTIIPTYFISKFAKKYVTVVLTGEGADETFAGYEQYKLIKIYNFLKKRPYFVRNYLVKVVKHTPNTLLDKVFKYSSDLGDEGKNRVKNFLLSKTDYDAYFSIVSIYSNLERKRILQKNFPDEFKKIFTSCPKTIDKFLIFELNTTLPEGLLMKVDKMTMAHSIEGRVPFLDHKLVEFSFSIPENLKLRNLKDKYILRKFARQLLPKEAYQKRKQRFFVPIHEWFKTDLMSYADEFISKESIKQHNVYDYSYVEKIKRRFNSSPLYYSRQLWCLLVFEIWRDLLEKKGKL